MRRIWAFSSLFALALAFASSASATTASENAQCFDIAIIATAPHYHWFPLKAGPDEIIMRWPVSIRFEVKKVMSGAYRSKKIETMASMHTRFNPRIRQFLLFLKEDGKGGYSLEEMHYQLVRDRSGRLVWPIAAPLDPSYTERGFTPADYETLMRPIHYRPKDAWWLVTPPDVDPPSADEYSWAKLDSSRTIIASRGIVVSDLVAAAAKKRCPPSAVQ